MLWAPPQIFPKFTSQCCSPGVNISVNVFNLRVFCFKGWEFSYNFDLESPFPHKGTSV